jgi:uncharacterized membrane-anchored protein YitT (DUF2179 family)
MNWNWKTDGKRVAGVLLAAALMALNMKTFVHAGDLYPGGVTGLTVLIQRLADKYWGLQLPYSPISLLLNAFPVYVGFRFVGKKFTLLSLVMIMLSGFLTDLIPAYTLTQDILLISIFGGIVNGFAISLCLRADATSGGTDFIAIYLSQMHGVESWNLILGFNAVLLLIGGYFFGPDKALYSIIFQYASTQVLHLMHRNYQKVTFLIVTDKAEQICAGIHDMTHHGATIFHGEGGYGHNRRNLVYSVISGSDVRGIKKGVREIDPAAFVNTFSSGEIMGNFYMQPKD